MTSREVALDLAAFLESPPSGALSSIDRAAVRRIVESFLECCYDGLGKAPRFLDGDDIHGILGHLLPGKFNKKDPLARDVVPVLRAFIQFTEGRAVVSQSYEIHRALENNQSLFLEIVESGKVHTHGHSHGPAEKPFIHKADKTGRNDPCPCGSGKKFKQCCAKIGS